VVEKLRSPVEGADRGNPAADHTEVEGGDADARYCSGEHGAATGEDGGEHDAPPERDRHVGRTAGDHRAAPYGPRRRQKVVAFDDRERRRRGAAERGPRCARDNAVG
jgi:hypothetical protein